jgi:hypothetical protein
LIAPSDGGLNEPIHPFDLLDWLLVARIAAARRERLLAPGTEADHHPGKARCQKSDRGPLDRDETDGLMLRAFPIGEIGGDIADAADDVELVDKSFDQGPRGVRDDPVAVGVCDATVRTRVRVWFHQAIVTAPGPDGSATTQRGENGPLSQRAGMSPESSARRSERGAAFY